MTKDDWKWIALVTIATLILFTPIVVLSVKQDSASRSHRSEVEQMKLRLMEREQTLKLYMQKSIEADKALEERNQTIAVLTKELETLKSKPVSVQKASATEELTGFQVTWYNDTGITRSGRHTEDGVSASVDPAIIPLGTWLEIEMPDGTVYKRRADDTGGAVKGRVVDIYAARPTAELIQKGRTRGVVVRLLGGET